MNKSQFAFQETEQIMAKPRGKKDFYPLAAVLTLFEEFNRNQLRYCHWKSNSRLDWALEGKTDLDLLIDPDQEKLFKGIINSLGIKKISAPPSKQYPGLEHYLGYDQETGNLFHLHVHFQMVLGEQYVKNYRLPLENQFLSFVCTEYGVHVPIPELELIVLSIRALLKYRDRDVIKDVFTIKSPGIPQHILDEILWLLNQTSIESVKGTLSDLSIFADQSLIIDFLQIVKQAPRSGLDLYQLRTRLRRELKKYQRQSRIRASVKYFKSLLEKTKIFGNGKEKLLILPEGGQLIALIGIDGSGKSTHTVELAKWLEWKVSAPLHYLGSKQPSIWSDLFYLIFRMFRRTGTELSKKFKDDHFLIQLLQRFRQFFLALHYLSVGFDRYKRYRIAKKQAAAGSVVIFDRFPFFSPLDGPEIHLISAGQLHFLTKKLSKVEKRLYRKFDYLDLAIILDVDPKASIQRKPDHPMSTIMAKHFAVSRLKTMFTEELDQWNWATVDSNAPIDQVLLDLKETVWSQL